MPAFREQTGCYPEVDQTLRHVQTSHLLFNKMEIIVASLMFFLSETFLTVFGNKMPYNREY